MFDVDFVNFKVEDVENLIRFLIENKVDMIVGIFFDGRFFIDFVQKILFFLLGQRGIKRWVFEKILELCEDIKNLGYVIEIIFIEYVKKFNLRVLIVLLLKVLYVMKEEKFGFIKGVQYWMKMYLDIIKGYVNFKKSRDG